MKSVLLLDFISKNRGVKASHGRKRHLIYVGTEDLEMDAPRGLAKHLRK